MIHLSMLYELNSICPPSLTPSETLYPAVAENEDHRHRLDDANTQTSFVDCRIPEGIKSARLDRKYEAIDPV
jgi:hypothetical protein